MSERSTGAALEMPAPAATALASRFSWPARKAGLAYDTPDSLDQSRAIKPVNEASIIARKRITTARGIMPLGSWRRGRQARAQRPGDSCWAGGVGLVRPGIIVAPPYLSETRASTNWSITPTRR